MRLFVFVNLIFHPFIVLMYCYCVNVLFIYLFIYYNAHLDWCTLYLGNVNCILQCVMEVNN